MRKKTFAFLVAALSTICYAEPIYKDSRQVGINLFNRGQYLTAVKQFISVQAIAPVNNDLSYWITKCNNKIIQERNAKIRKRHQVAKTNNPQMSPWAGMKIQGCDSIGHYGSANLALVKSKNRYGFINRDSIIVVPIIYDDVYSIIVDAIPGSDYDKFIKAHNLKWNWSWDKGQLMSVCKDGKWGYINEKGTEVISIIYDDVKEPIVFKGRHLIGVGNDGKYGFVNWDNKVIIPLEYDCISRYYQGVFGTDKLGLDMVPVVKNGRMGFIDNKGQIVIPFEFEPQYNLDYNVAVMFRPVWHDGITDLKKNGKYGIVDLKGHSITGFKYDGPGELNLVKIGYDYETYFIFPIGSSKVVYYFNGKEYHSEAEFNQAVASKISSNETNLK